MIIRKYTDKKNLTTSNKVDQPKYVMDRLKPHKMPVPSYLPITADTPVNRGKTI